MPLLYSVLYAIVNIIYNQSELEPTPIPDGVLTLYLLTVYSRGVLLMIAAGFLADSIFRIRRAIYKVDSQ